MKYKRFNNTDLDVSVLCLGTSPFGTSTSKLLAFEQMSTFADLGGNFMDTAHIYGDWESSEKAISEKIIGEWMKLHDNRAKMIISTKGGHPLLESMDVSRVCIDELETDLKGSLEALQTDTIDLYFLHRDNPSRPVSEIIEWLEVQRVNGRIRYYGASNWSLLRLVEAQQYAQSRGFHGFVCNQILDSLADINHTFTEKQQMVVADRSFLEYHSMTGLNLMAYMAIAHGYFVYKEQNIPIPEEDEELFDLPENERMYEVMKSIRSYSANDFNYQYILQRRYPAIPITSFLDLDQIRDAVNSCCKEMPFELIDKVSKYKRSG